MYYIYIFCINLNQQNNISNNNSQQFDLTFHTTKQNNLNTNIVCHCRNYIGNNMEPMHGNCKEMKRE